MGNAGRNGGEYYTPRPLIRAMVQVTAPQIGETIYDAPAARPVLCEAFDYLSPARDQRRRSENAAGAHLLRQGEKSLAYVIAIMRNMILHGIEAPNIQHTNTLAENLADVQEKDRFDIVLANPPFGGKERKEVQQNFPIRTGETAFLFLQHFIKLLRAGGRASSSRTRFSNTDNASVSLRKHLLRAATRAPCSIAPAAPSSARASKPSCCFSRKAHRPERSGTTSSIPAATWAKPTAQRRRSRQNSSRCKTPLLNRAKAGAWTRGILTPPRSTSRVKTRTPSKPSPTAVRSPRDIMDEIAALDAEAAEFWRVFRALLAGLRRSTSWAKRAQRHALHRGYI